MRNHSRQAWRGLVKELSVFGFQQERIGLLNQSVNRLPFSDVFLRGADHRAPSS